LYASFLGIEDALHLRIFHQPPLERAFKQAEGIYDTLMQIFKMSAEEGIPTNDASDRLAEQRIQNVAKLRTFYTSTPGRVFRRG